MKAVIFDSDKSTLQLVREIQLLKICYLICDEVCAGGQVASNLTFEEDYKKYSLNQKLHFMINQLSAQKYNDTEKYIGLVNDFIGILKKSKKIKRITKESMVSISKTAKLYTNWFNDIAIAILEEFQKLGILDMRHWKEEGVLTCAVEDYYLPEPKFKNDKIKNAKELLELIFPSNTATSSIMVFPNDLIANAYLTPEQKLDLVEKEGIPLKGVNIYNCIKIPSIASLTSLELKALRGQLNEFFVQFRLLMDNWIQYCKLNDEINIQVKTLKEEVLSKLTTLQTDIDQNIMLNSFVNNTKIDTSDLEIYIGIAPVESIWKYYEEFKVLDTETLNMMRDIINLNKPYTNFLPIICVTTSYRNLEQMEELIEQDRIASLDQNRTKKHLSID